MRSRQTGITFIGWLFLLAPVAIVLYAVIRLTPLYLNYMKVSKALTQTAAEYESGDQVSPNSVKDSLGRRWNIDSITFPDYKDIAVSRDGDTWQLVADYEDAVPMFAGISLVVRFQKRAVVD